MKIALSTRDGRLIARIINLAHRFGCSYDGVSAQRYNGGFVGTIDLSGATDSLRRLQKQVNKLISDDKEYFQ